MIAASAKSVWEARQSPPVTTEASAASDKGDAVYRDVVADDVGPGELGLGKTQPGICIAGEGAATNGGFCGAEMRCGGRDRGPQCQCAKFHVLRK